MQGPRSCTLTCQSTAASSHLSPWIDLLWKAASSKQGAIPIIPGASSDSATTFQTLSIGIFLTFLCTNTHNERQMGSFGSFFGHYFLFFFLFLCQQQFNQTHYRIISKFRRRTSAGRSGNRFFFTSTIFPGDVEHGRQERTELDAGLGLGKRDLEPEYKILHTNNNNGLKAGELKEGSRDERASFGEKGNGENMGDF